MFANSNSVAGIGVQGLPSEHRIRGKHWEEAPKTRYYGFRDGYAAGSAVGADRIILRVHRLAGQPEEQ